MKFGREEITYAELEARANCLARVLIAAGVRPDTLVPVCLERSVELIVALVGIIKSGGAYVALDPEHPPARLATMLEEVDGPALLTREGSALVSRLAGNPLPTPIGRVLPRRVAWSRAPGPDHLAYVSYTSGSTGKPKGVAVPHRGVLRLVVNGDCASFGPEEIFLQLAGSFRCFHLRNLGRVAQRGKLVIPRPAC